MRFLSGRLANINHNQEEVRKNLIKLKINIIESISKHFIRLPAISDKNKMSEISEERLKKLVEKCVNSAEMDEASMKSVRNLCRKDEAFISTVVAELLWFLKRKHCVVRFYKFYIQSFNEVFETLNRIVWSGCAAYSLQTRCFLGLMCSEFSFSRCLFPWRFYLPFIKLFTIRIWRTS